MSGALESGHFPEEGVGAGPGPGPELSRALAGADGKDLVKRARSVKGRFLFAFGGLLQAFAPGRFGALAGLDSPQPVLYVEFPQGRLKLFGDLVFPKATNYALLNVDDHRNRKDHVLIEEVFECLVVFSEAWWVGTAEENPEEKRLPVPEAVRRASGEAGPSGSDFYECGAVDCSLPGIPAAKRKAAAALDAGGEGGTEVAGGVGDDGDAPETKKLKAGPTEGADLRDVGGNGTATAEPPNPETRQPEAREEDARLASRAGGEAPSPTSAPADEPEPTKSEPTKPEPNVITLDWDSD